MVVTKGIYSYTLKVTRHLGHFFYLTTASRSVWCVMLFGIRELNKPALFETKFSNNKKIVTTNWFIKLSYFDTSSIKSI